MIRVLAIGEVVEHRFEVLERVAGGGSSTVYRGTDRKSGEEVAIKVLTDARDDFRQRFEREVGILAHLSHPVIVRYIAHGDLSPEMPYLVTEWMGGETLAARLRSPGLTMRESVQLAGDLSSALAVIHQHDLVHRDVKPANVVFTEPGGMACRLIDFGIARSTLSPRAITGTGIMVGTPGFISPEQARGSLSVGPPSDVFSLGCLLYMCVTGLAPFGSPSTPLTFMKIMTASPEPIRQLVAEAPAALEQLLIDMLAKDARRRPDTGAEVLARLAQVGPVPVTERRTAAAPAHARPMHSLPTGRGGEALDENTVAAHRSAVLVLGGGSDPLDDRGIERLVELARSVNASDVIALPDEVVVVRGTHTQLRPLVGQLVVLAFACLRDLGDRVLTIAEDREAEWAVETAQHEALTRLFEEEEVRVAGGPVVLVHKRLADLVGEAYVAETRGDRVLVRLRPRA
ncbi:MAG TPA: serine/threonine-protein kinase [Kofleriaceae bacterium]